MRAVGYPGRGTLTAWVREAFPESKTSIVGRSWRPAYPESLKQVGVIELCSGEESAQRVADRWAYVGRRCTTGKISYSVMRLLHL